MKKALFVATVYRFFAFERSDMQILKDMGYEIHTACNMSESEWLKDDGLLDDIGVVKHQVNFSRSPFSRQSYEAYKQLKKLAQKEHYDIIHCHTPVAGAITRLAVKGERKHGTKVIYTDHGFHFHKTSGRKTWLMFYPIEYLMAHYSNMILTINREDYGVISKFPVKEYRYIPGVGVDVEKISRIKINKDKIREKFGIPTGAYVVLSVGELSARKNHEVVIKAISEIPDKNIVYVICGTGNKQEELLKMADDKGIGERVILLGMQPHDVVMEITHAADICALPSLIEGLGLAGIEALAAGKPIVASGIHGIKDYVITGETGIRCNPHDPHEFKEAILKLYNDKELYDKCSVNARKMALNFDINKVRSLMVKNYQDLVRGASNDGSF